RCVAKETDASIGPTGHDPVGVRRYERIVRSVINGHTGQSVCPRANWIANRHEIIETLHRCTCRSRFNRTCLPGAHGPSMRPTSVDMYVAARRAIDGPN